MMKGSAFLCWAVLVQAFFAALLACPGCTPGVDANEADLAVTGVQLPPAEPEPPLPAPYRPGFTWNRWADWKAAKDANQPPRNPIRDAAGNPVWKCGYIGDVPAGSDPGSARPWYELPLTGLMVWDPGTGDGGTWACKRDMPPFVYSPPFGPAHIPMNKAYQGDHFARVPVVRWTNPLPCSVRVSLKSGPGFKALIHMLPTETVGDIVIAMIDASDGGSVHVLYQHTLVKTKAREQMETFELPPLEIGSLILRPGDDILITVRSRDSVNQSRWFSVLLCDDVTITLLSDRPGR